MDSLHVHEEVHGSQSGTEIKVVIHLREYQEQALEAERLHRIEHPEESRLAIVIATGLGKTIIMAERARRFLNKGYDTPAHPLGNGRVLILVHTDELASQAEAKVRLVAGQQIPGLHQEPWTVGVVKAGRNEVDADIIIGSVQTLANPTRRQQITDVGLVLVDECHHATANSYQAIMRHFGCLPAFDGTQIRRNDGYPVGGPIPALGFTATLERGDGQGLGEVWQNVCFTRDISWGVRKGYLVQPVGHRLEIVPGGYDCPRPEYMFKVQDGRFAHTLEAQDEQLVDSMAPEKIVEKWLEIAAGLCEECLDALNHVEPKCMPSYCPNGWCGVNRREKVRPTVAFMPLVRSAGMLADAFSAAGISARVIYGELPEKIRRAYLAMYEAGELQVLVNAMVLTEGWDSPRTKCVIIGRPTKSRPLFVQMAGRGLRPVPGVPVEDQECILLCVADSTDDLCTVADLSDRKLDRRAQGALTAMEDQWDLVKQAGIEPDPATYWTGRVDVREFDPLVTRSSKVWRTTEHGTPFLPISKDGEYVFIVGTSVFVRTIDFISSMTAASARFRTARLHKDLPDLELAMAVAEDEAQERGGDLGRLLADKARPWRKQVPSAEMIAKAHRAGLERELRKIMESKAGGKAGRLSDLISKKMATRALEPVVEKIKAAIK